MSLSKSFFLNKSQKDFRIKLFSSTYESNQ